MAATAILHVLLLMTAAGLLPAEDPGDRLREAARAGDLAQVRALLDSGVPVDSPAPRHGNTPLLLAAEQGHLEIAKLLLDRGADVNARESFFRTTPLTAALYRGHVELAHLLLKRGAAQAADALASAFETDDVELARAAVATGRLTPLELKAARRAADAAGKEKFKELLAAATSRPAERRPADITAEMLRSYSGKYRVRGGADVTVDVRGKGLVMTGLGDAEIVLIPVAEDYFETASGDTGVTFGGRGGLIEGAQVNRDGEIVGMGVATPEPLPMKTASGVTPDDAPRGAARPWPQFRGAGASGNADGQAVPLRWDVAKGENIRFKTPIPGIALSSPVVWGDRIFVTTAVSEKGDATFRTGLYGDPTSVDDLSEHSFRLYALDTKTGAIVWQREVHRAKPTVRRHLKSSLANATPATDGKRVVVLFGAVGVLAAYDFAGEKIWQRDVGVLDCNDPQSGAAEWGHASSPILHGDLVLIQGDRRRDSFVAAYRIKDGSPAWREARDEASTWATPNVVTASSGDELVTNGRTVRAYDPSSGRLLWTLGPNSEVVVATPVAGAGKIFITAGYPPVRPIYAIRPGHRGDLSLESGADRSEAVAWSRPRGGTYIPTPLYYQGHLYLINNNGYLACYRADSGEQVYQTRVGEAGASFSASPVAADGRIYFASETGPIYVLRAGAQFEMLATNDMNEVVMATPAASDGLLVVRTLGQIVGIAKRGDAAGR